MKTEKTLAPDMTPTSGLPFASRQCDVDSLDFFQSGASPEIEAMNQALGGNPVRASAVDFAQRVNCRNERLSAFVDVLKTVEDLLKWAHRGGSPDGLAAVHCFSRATSMLSLSVESLEIMTDELYGDMTDFCKLAVDDQTSGAALARSGT